MGRFKTLSCGFVFLILFLLVLSLPVLSSADFPDRPIEIVIPFGPGSNTDRVILTMCPFMEKELGQKFMPNYRSGGGGTIGPAWLAKAKPDGYNLGVIPPGPLLVKPLTSNLPYSVKDFVPIAQIGTVYTLFWVRDDAKWKNLQELLGDIKQNPEKYTFGSTGPFSMGHVAMEALKQKAGIKVKHVPFEGANKLTLALLGSQVDFLVTELPYELVKDGKIRALAAFTEKRLPEFPNVATMKEQGYDLVIEVWYCLIAPKSTPQAIIDKVEGAAKKTAANKEFQDLFLKTMGVPVNYLGSKEMAAKWERENGLIRDVIANLNLSRK